MEKGIFINNKMILTSLIIIPLLLGYFSSCKEKEENKSTSIITADLSDASNLFNSNIIESIKFVKLETTRECIIGSLKEIYIWNENIFIHDEKTNKLLRFNLQGEFLNDFGEIGKGPGEMIGLKSFFVNHKTHQIELLVYPRKILIFTFEGDLIDEFQNPNHVPAVSFARNTNNNIFLYGGHNNGFDNNRLFLLNEDGRILNKYFPEKTNLLPFEEQSNFFILRDQIFFREAFSNTIFRLTEKEAYPCCRFDFKEYNLPPNLPQGFFMDIKKFAYIFNYFRNDDFMLSTIILQNRENIYPNFFLLLNYLNSDKNVIVELPSLANLIESFTFPFFLTETNEIVFIINPADLHLNPEWFMSHPILNSVYDEINSVDENSNPILVFASIAT